MKSNDRYRWIALSNTTLGVFMAFLNTSIVIIALPAIFRGVHLNPLAPGNVGYLLWMLLAFNVSTAVLVVAFGRLGDIFGRVRLYNLGFLIFTIASVGLVLTPGHGGPAAMWLISWRVIQGIGGALIFANSTAIIADAFPVEKRGMALGINQIAGLAGSFIGLIVGGILADINWRLIFFVSVPFGIFGTFWAYHKLIDLSPRRDAKVDYIGGSLFAAGLILILVSITYGIQPATGATMSWGSSPVLIELFGGIGLLMFFLVVESRVSHPMVDLKLFNIKPFAVGNTANLLAAISRGGLQFMLILWLQGIWLPLHGYSFTQTPLWAGIYMLPLTAGFLIAGPASGYLSDRFGARSFATGGMALAALTFLLFLVMPVNFSYLVFGSVLFLNGVGFGLFAAPNTTAVMNSVPPSARGSASGVLSTFMNSGQILSIGIFFSLMIAGLSSSLPRVLFGSLTGLGISPTVAAAISKFPPVGSLFAAFLGFNPLKVLTVPFASQISISASKVIYSSTYYPGILSSPFKHGLSIAFGFAAIFCVTASFVSAFRGKKYVYGETISETALGAGSDEAGEHKS